MSTLTLIAQPPIPFNSASQILKAFLPPNFVVHVGWGNGIGEITQWTQWPIANALIVESEESKPSSTQSLLASKAGWHTVHATLAAISGEEDYYLASNPSESGLLPPEQLRHIWPHLNTVAKRTVTVTTLDVLWQQTRSLWASSSSSDSLACTWLIIDCVTSKDILAGALLFLQETSLVCARSLVQDKAELASLLQQSGWIEVCWTESHHPSVGYSWFARDPALIQTAFNDSLAVISQQLDQTRVQLQNVILTKDELELQLDTALDSQRVVLAERDALAQAKEAETVAKNQALSERDALAKAKEAETAAKNQALAERDALAQAKEAETVAKNQALAERDALAQGKEAETVAKNQALAERDALTKAKEAETAAKNQALAERDALAKAKEAETAAKNQAHAERDALAKAKEAALAQRDAFEIEKANLIALSDEQTALASAHQRSLLVQQQDATALQQHNQQLETVNQENALRQKMLKDEIIKAEAQIELIKDLLLRDSGL